MPDSSALGDAYTMSDRARLVAEEPSSSSRSAFARDRARVLHSAALRRLAAKTQVVVAGQLDFPRTRLTHTLEVAQIARELGAALGCDPDLVEVAGLAHDLGHPPYGHNGESALAEAAADIGGFEGNAQSLRVLTRLEAKVIDPVTGHSCGLNLTRAALDAATKYPWPLRSGTRKFGVYADDRPVFDWLRADSPGESTCLEAQVMDWADDVAYSVHDVEDAVHAGHVDMRVFSSPQERAEVIALASRHYARDVDPSSLSAALDRLRALDVWMSAYDASMRDLAALKRLTSQLIGRFCVAAESATRARWGGGQLTRYAATLVVPDGVRHEVAVMKAVAAHYVMNRDGAERIYEDQRALLLSLVTAMVQREGRDLDPWLHDAFAQAVGDGDRLRVVIDQVASLTDVSVVEWARRLGV